MAKKTKVTIMSLEYRAVCDDDTFKGKWHEDIRDARADAKAHRDASSDNKDHIIRIVTRQTSNQVFP